MTELAVVPVRKFRKTIPEKHRASLDTMIHWLWHQRFGTVQTIWQESQKDRRVLDHTACTLVLQAIMGKDLESISQIFQRIEGGALHDKELLDQETSIRL
jgi:hypothetical protein